MITRNGKKRIKRLKGKPDLSTWSLDAFEEINGQWDTLMEPLESAIDKLRAMALDQLKEIVQKATSEALNIALRDDYSSLSFPIVWTPDEDGEGNPSVRDPLTIYVCIGLGPGEFEGDTIFALSLREALAFEVQTCADDGSWCEGLGQLVPALRQWADEIETAVSKGKVHAQQNANN